MYLTRISKWRYLNSDPSRQPWTERAQKVPGARRIDGVDYGGYYIGRADDYDKLWSARLRFMASNCGGHKGTAQTAATTVPRLFRLLYESRLCTWVWIPMEENLTTQWKRNVKNRVCAVPGVTGCCAVIGSQKDAAPFSREGARSGASWCYHEDLVNSFKFSSPRDIRDILRREWNVSLKSDSFYSRFSQSSMNVALIIARILWNIRVKYRMKIFGDDISSMKNS